MKTKSSKSNSIKVTSPKATVVFANITEPNVRFNPQGEFDVTVIMDREEAEKAFAEPLKSLEKYVEGITRLNPKKASKIRINELLREIDVDDLQATKETKASEWMLKVLDGMGYEGDGSDLVLLKLKKNAVTKQGDSLTVPVYDAKGNLLEKSPEIGMGSTIKVSAVVYEDPYDGAMGIGLSARLGAIKIIKLKSFGGSSGAGGGFDDDEEYDEDDAYVGTVHQSKSSVATSDLQDDDFDY